MRFTHFTVLTLTAPVALSFVVQSSFRSSNLVENKRYPIIPEHALTSSRHHRTVLYMADDDSSEPPLKGRDRTRKLLEQQIADAQARRDELLQEIQDAETSLEQAIADAKSDVARKQKALESFEQEVNKKKEKLENVDKQILDLSEATAPLIAVTSLAALGAAGRAALTRRERQLEEEALQEQIRAREAASTTGKGASLVAVSIYTRGLPLECTRTISHVNALCLFLDRHWLRQFLGLEHTLALAVIKLSPVNLSQHPRNKWQKSRGRRCHLRW